MTDPAPPPASFEPLAVVAKKRFPFPLACPSFVYRAGYSENVRLLAPYVDEIQLLFFESRAAGSLPSPGLIRELSQLRRTCRVRFNVHLPADLDLGHRQAAERRRAVAVLTDLIARCTPLMPSTFTLHLSRRPSETDDGRWQADTAASLEALLAAGIAPRRLSVENLDYDFDLAAPLVETMDLSVCMDMGHLMAQGRALEPFFERWRDRITTVHLHGVEGTADHLPLDRLPPTHMAEALRLLGRFTGVVSLEVYSVAALNASLRHLLAAWNQRASDGGRR